MVWLLVHGLLQRLKTCWLIICCLACVQDFLVPNAKCLLVMCSVMNLWHAFWKVLQTFVCKPSFLAQLSGLLEHYFSSNMSSPFHGCVDIQHQYVSSFEDTDHTAFILSVLSLVGDVDHVKLRIKNSTLYTRVNQTCSEWPRLADTFLKDKIKSIFDKEIIQSCTVKGICAACSLKLMSDNLIYWFQETISRMDSPTRKASCCLC